MPLRTVCILLAFILIVQSIRAEEPKPLLPSQLCVAKNRDLLQTVLRHISNELGQVNLDFPPEIDTNDWWNIAWVTDGNEQWPIVSLPLDAKQLAEIDHHDAYFGTRDFKTRLITDKSLLRFVFPKSAITQVRGNRLYLIPYDFPWARLDKLDLEKPWAELQQQYDLAWLSESVELRLFTDLPPEKPNEGSFLREARTRKKSLEAKNGSAVERMLLGIRFDEKTELFHVDLKNTTMPGTGEARHRQFLDNHGDSFRVGGFYDDKSLVSGAMRWYPLNETHFDHYLFLKFGVAFIPLEERQQTDRAMHFMLSFNYTTKPEIEALADTFDIFWSGNMAFASPLSSPEDRHEDYPINGAELNELNRRTLGSFRHWLENLRQATLTWDKEQPFDIACLMEGHVFYLGMAFPPGGENPDWSPLNDVEKAVNDLFYRTRRTEEIESESKPFVQFHYDVTSLETKGETAFTSGTIALMVDARQVNVRYLYAQHDDLHCFAIPLAEAFAYFNGEENPQTDGDSDEFVEKYRPILERKIETSKHLQAEKMKVPLDLARFSVAGNEIRIESATKGREQRYSLYAGKDSLWVLAFFSVFLSEITKNLRDVAEP